MVEVRASGIIIIRPLDVRSVRDRTSPVTHRTFSPNYAYNVDITVLKPAWMFSKIVITIK